MVTNLSSLGMGITSLVLMGAAVSNPIGWIFLGTSLVFQVCFLLV